MPSCSESETLGSEKNFGAHIFLNLGYDSMEQILMHICCNVCQGICPDRLHHTLQLDEILLHHILLWVLICTAQEE